MSLPTAPAGDSGRERRPLCSCVACNEMLCMPSLHPHEWQKLDWDKTEMKAQQNTDAMLTPEEWLSFFASWRSWQRKSNLARWAIMQSSSGRDGKKLSVTWCIRTKHHQDEELRYYRGSAGALCLLLMTLTSVFSQVTEGEEAGDNENTAGLPERWMTCSGELEERKMDNAEGER